MRSQGVGASEFETIGSRTRRKGKGTLLAGDEADELGDALLDGLPGVPSDLSVLRHRAAHDAPDVGDRQESVLLLAPATGVGLHLRHAETLDAAMVALAVRRDRDPDDDTRATERARRKGAQVFGRSAVPQCGLPVGGGDRWRQMPRCTGRKGAAVAARYGMGHVRRSRIP